MYMWMFALTYAWTWTWRHIVNTVVNSVGAVASHLCLRHFCQFWLLTVIQSVSFSFYSWGNKTWVNCSWRKRSYFCKHITLLSIIYWEQRLRGGDRLWFVDHTSETSSRVTSSLHVTSVFSVPPLQAAGKSSLLKWIYMMYMSWYSWLSVHSKVNSMLCVSWKWAVYILYVNVSVVLQQWW